MTNKSLFALILTLFMTTLTSCNLLPLEIKNSQFQSNRIKFIVLHYTAADFEYSLSHLSETGNVSSHYLIPQQDDPSYNNARLKVINLVKENNSAWHAGKSYWQGKNNINDQSIGIELVNIPECHPENLTKTSISLLAKDCHFPDYNPKQIELLITLIKSILDKYPSIGPTQIIGHSDIATNRKLDPGPRFPWHTLYKAGIGAWYETETVQYYRNLFSINRPDIGLVQSALSSYGYRLPETSELDPITIKTLSAFQMHFLPWQVSGKADNATVARIFALLDKYEPKKLTKLMTQYEKGHSFGFSEKKSNKFNQLTQVFPTNNRSSRLLVNDKAQFKSYKGKSDIIIEPNNTVRADIYINGDKIKIQQPFAPFHSYRYSLKKRTQDGINTLKVTNIEPQDASLNVGITFPVLSDNTTQQKTDFKLVDKLINSEVKSGFPGAVLMVIKDGEIIKHSAYGYSRKFDDAGQALQTPVKMKTSTLFDLASNTKMYATNMAIMKLVSEGKIDINKSISSYIPEYRGQGRETRKVKDLLAHKAGYSAVVDFHRSDNTLGEAFLSHDMKKTKELLITKVPFNYKNGQKHIYSDVDHMLLGVLIEKVTGSPLDIYVEHNIYSALALKNTLFNPLLKGHLKSDIAATEIQGNSKGNHVFFTGMRKHVIQGEVHDEKAFHSLSGIAGHAGLFSSAKDLAVLSQLLLNGGGYGNKQMFDQHTLKTFLQSEPLDASYGLGWRLNDGLNKWHFGPYASLQAYGHTGWTGTVTVIDPKYELAIILLTNVRHSKVVKQGRNYVFSGKQYETGRYGSVISLIYEAIFAK